MSSQEMTVEQARAKLGDLVIAAMSGRTTTITRYGDPVAQIGPIRKPTMTLTIVRGEQPNANGEEFGLAGVDVGEEVYEWFEANGVRDDDPDVWVLVTPADEFRGDLANVIATREV